MFVTALAMLTSGCATVTVTEGEHPRASVRNFGWTLFGCVPLVCGNARVESWMPCTFFWNDTATNRLNRVITQMAAAKEMQVKRLSATDDGSVFFSIPQAAFMLPIPYLVTYRDVTLTADLVTDAEVKANARSQRLKREMTELLNSLPND